MRGWKRALTQSLENESTREGKELKFRERAQMQAEEQISSENFLFFRCHVSLQGTNGEKVSRISERDTTLERESARAFYITYFIYLSRRERQRIKRDDDDDDDASSSSSRPRSRSLFLLVGEY